MLMVTLSFANLCFMDVINVFFFTLLNLLMVSLLYITENIHTRLCYVRLKPIYALLHLFSLMEMPSILFILQS